MSINRVLITLSSKNCSFLHQNGSTSLFYIYMYCLILLSDWDDIKLEEKTCSTGKNVQFLCDYPKSHADNDKFFCKGENPFDCKDVITEQKTSEGRYSMRVNGRSEHFIVNIMDLRADDAGTYWCGSDRTWQPANYTRIRLSVGE